jgi:predicted type IV restriction endonuclease
MPKMRFNDMTLQEHIEDIKNNLINKEYPNEQSICQCIVLRLLSKMQWNIHDYQFVIPEYSIQGKRVDYALCIKKNQPVIFIEVKQPGNILGADKQLFEYAFHKGVPFAIVTDGKEWHFYLPAEQGNYDERKIYRLDLIEDDMQESSYRLRRYLSFSEVTNGNAFKNAREDYEKVCKERDVEKKIPIAWKKLLKDEDDTLLDVVSKKVEGICDFKPTQKQIISYLSSLRADVASSPVKQVKKNTDDHIPKPATVPTKTSGKAERKKIKIIFPDGTQICNNRVKDTLIEVIRKIGFEKVKGLGIQRCGFPIVSKQKYKEETYKSWNYDDTSRLFLFTGTSTDDKRKLLYEINERLALRLKVEMVNTCV